MNKSELIEVLASRLEGDRKTAATALNALLDEIARALVKGEKVAITGFGSFEKRERAARVARNPRTGETVRVKKTSVPAFKAGNEFKEIVAGRRKLAKAARVAKAAPAKKAAVKKAAPAKKAAVKKAAPARKAPAKKAAVKKVAAKRAR